jgi:polyphenol oxidase
MLTPTVHPPFPLNWGFTTRQDGPSGLPDVRLHQMHGCGILEAGPGPFQRLEGDGLWTTRRRVLLGVRTADCVSILLAGEVAAGPWIATLHAGWRGTTAGMLRRGVALFESLGGRPEGLWHAFGPCIQPCHFEVGPEVLQAARLDPAWSGELARPGPRGRPHLDLHGLLRAQARDLGLDAALEGSVARCTVCEPDAFFSYRRGDLEGRQWGFAELL